ncbi:CHAT domain-containing protein [Halorussus gelatinilyticus]|uniref:CHAT domain-containing protein n=1 Tax=Halorussus gelatinilyticus TaxID=2937524 RepID=A0A8U0IPT0_9EURY|nr:CHAT domain-containing protein [Halorussus gelatinilyticus]UPW02019.1 CHAT domain-containing protein [Halorussus gelatinilyticus]
MKPTFDTLDDEGGFEVVDPIETRRFTFSTPNPVEPTPADPDSFRFPVSSACRVETSELVLPYIVMSYVRDADGEVLADLGHDASAEFSPGTYIVDLSAPIKLYLRAEAGLRIESSTKSMRIAFDRETTVEVGARSFHKSPAATVTTTDDPHDVMSAVSTLGSVLKTTTCERSWPTLRGHPPRIERGDELDVPDDLAVPATGATVEVPPAYDAIYAAAPLSYYFGADLVAGETPRLTVGGFERRFDAGEGFEDDVVRTLKQAFFLDCVTRTEGYYPIELAGRNRLESLVDVDFAALYDAPLGEQLSTYFSIPYETVAEAMPSWHRVAYVRPDPENVEALPYLVNDFSILRTPPRPTYDETDEMRETRDAIEGFKRTPSPGDSDERPESERDAAARRGVPPVEEYVQMPDHDDALELAWVGDGTPVRGTKVLPEAYRYESSGTSDDVIEITVVCNDEEMREEWDAVAEVYGPRDTISFDPTVHFNVTTDELEDLLRTPTDLFHYVGHIDGRGFECSDGVLDARTLDEVGMRAFLLNACRSHNQGVALVEAGCHGGIVSLGNVGNSAAVELGETLAKLFQAGFSIGGALAITREATFIGTRYIAVGDAGFTLAPSADIVPLMYKFEDSDEPPLSLTAFAYPTREHAIGSVSGTYLEVGPRFLSTGPYHFESTKERMLDAYDDNPYSPLIIDGELVLANQWLEK